MAVSGEIKIEGINALKEKLTRRVQQLQTILDVALLQVCEEAVTYSKFNKGYKDRTANLKNSISFALFRDGQLIRMVEGRIPKPDATDKGQAEVSENLSNYCNQEGVVAPSGYSLVIVAGMNYGPYVERKGYNVLYLTKYFLADELKKAVEEAIEIVTEE